MTEIRVEDWGTVAYDVAHARQIELRDARIADTVPDTLVIAAHPPVITLGRQGSMSNLRVSEDTLARMNIPLRHVERGGDITYHGPGQIVAYPVVTLPVNRRDVKGFVRMLEAVLLDVCADAGVRSRRIPGLTGVWTADEGDDGTTPWHGEKKLAAIGVAFRRWVSWHGVALNVAGDLTPFSCMHPCGLDGKSATSLSAETGREVAREEIVPVFVHHFTRHWRHFAHGS